MATKTKTASITIEGTSPMLMHADSVQWADQVKAWTMKPDNKKKSVAGDDRSPAWRWIGGLWHDGEHICIPSTALLTCIRQAAAKVPTGHRQQTWKSGSQSALIPTAPYYELLANGKTVDYKKLTGQLLEEEDFAVHESVAREHGFVLDVQRARPQTTKHVRVRPRFDNWAFVADFVITDESILPALESIMDVAGRLVGLGNWRPSAPTAPGPFGLFTASVEVK